MLVRDTDFVPSTYPSNRTYIFRSRELSRAMLRTGFWDQTSSRICKKKTVVSGLSLLCRAARIIDEMMRVMGSCCPSFARTMDICSLAPIALPERHGRFPWLVKSQVCLTVQTWKHEPCKEHIRHPHLSFYFCLYICIGIYKTDFTQILYLSKRHKLSDYDAEPSEQFLHWNVFLRSPVLVRAHRDCFAFIGETHLCGR